MSRVLIGVGPFALVLAIASVIGCGGPESPDSPQAKNEHDHERHHNDDQEHDHASHDDGHGHGKSMSYAEAVGEIDKLHTEIKTAFEASDFDKMDGPVHEIGHALEGLSASAAKSSFSEADADKVKKSVDALIDSFGAIDERIHGGPKVGKAYDEVSADIKAAITELKSVINQGSTP